MDVFGVAPSSIAELDRCFGAGARELVAAASEGSSRQRELKERLERQVKEAGGFKQVEVSLVFGFDSNASFHLTFDVTPSGGRPPVKFLPEPKGDIPDPDGLIASWQEYEKVGGGLAFDDQLPDSPACPAHHCIFGFDHPKLQPYGERFGREVPLREDDLVRVLNEDRDPKKRASAAYLLAHLPKAEDVLRALLPRLNDPDANPRNSILRVLGAMAEHGEGSGLPLQKIFPFLRSPSLSDRNKAVSIVAALSSDVKKRRSLLRDAGCDLVRLSELKQPNQVEFARESLIKVRGADLEASTPSNWRKWLKTQGVACHSTEQLLEPGSLCPLPPRSRSPAKSPNQ